MKKITHLIVTLLLAVGLSSFSSPQPTYYYRAGLSFAIFTGVPCPAAVQAPCIRLQPGVGNVAVLKSQNDNDPLRYNP
jgi:hypothetical protein